MNMRYTDTIPLVSKDGDKESMVCYERGHRFVVLLEETIDCVDEFMRLNAQLISECRKLLARVNRHNRRTNYARLVGVGLSAIGAVTLLVKLWPLTGVVAAVVAIGGGATTGVGTITQAGAHLGNYFLSKSFYKRLFALADRRNQSADRLRRKLAQFDDLLADSIGLDNISVDGLSLYKALKALAKLVGGTAFTVGSATINTNRVLDGLAALGAIPVIESGRFLLYIKSMVGGKVGVKIGIAVGRLAWTAWDAFELYRDWNKAHPTVEAINGLITDLESDHKNIQSVLKSRSLPSNGSNAEDMTLTDTIPVITIEDDDPTEPMDDKSGSERNADHQFVRQLDEELEALNECVHEFWLKNSSLVESCEELLARVNRHKRRTNIAKSVATGVSGVGGLALVGGVALAPFTGGLSTVLTVGGGATTAAAAVTTIGADVGDYFRSRGFYQRLRAMADSRNACAVRLSRKLAEFDVSLRDAFGLNRANQVSGDGLGVGRGVELMYKSSVGFYKMGNNAVKLMDAVQEFRAFRVAKSVKTAEQSASASQKMGKSVVSLLPTETNAVVKSAVPATGKLALKGGMAAFTLALTVVDAVYLVRDWNKAHPTVEAINGLITDLESDHKTIQSIHAMIKRAFSDDVLDDQLIDEILNAIEGTNDCHTIADSDAEEVDNSISIDLNGDSVSYRNLQTICKRIES
ncbi:unnamed protein product [Medioppia subpectinata]|uniref:Apolipoprotein L3 n=1 Tax=Medioppia subpectinata TaxID=1979941 RepID=A0A7R9Q147_9ACAR|nr:unnamed protein product [Medioppia subpectinata]CAG2107941.1 unnamed protein product [Medioppia subpectinata]